MKKIEIDSTEFQEFSIPFEGELVTVTLNFRFDNWLMSVSYKDKEVNNLRLSSGVLMLTGKNYPFDILIDDKGTGLDPFRADSFEEDMFDFNFIDREEVESLRGYEVE